MFEGDVPSYDRLRPLFLSNPILSGEDVYALQTACKALGADPGALDGAYGKQTDTAVRRAQTVAGTYSDGRVGPKSWIAFIETIGVPIRKRHGLPPGALYGQVGHESGFRGGMYSWDAPREDGHFDAGATQRNTEYHGFKAPFDVPSSLDLLAKEVRESYDLYHGVTNSERRWDLAQGSWNAPYYANWLAWEEGARHITAGNRAQPGPTARRKLEEYIVYVTTYRR